MHQFLTLKLYENWKNEGVFNVYKMVYNIELLNCGIIENNYGKWVQCQLRMSHKDASGEIVTKCHIIERKLVNLIGYKREWYFC